MEKNDVGKKIQMLSRQIKRRMDTALSEYQITGRQVAILLYIYEESKKRDVYAKDIELAFDMRRASVTGILKLMEKNGIIIREGISKDARLKKLILTDRAKEARQKLKKEIISVEKNLTKDIPKENLKIFCSVMNKMSKNLCEKEKKKEEIKW